MLNFFKNLFNKTEQKNSNEFIEISKPKILEKDLSTLSQFDDVWVEVNNNIFEGWVVEKIKNQIYISYTNENHKLNDAVFTIERPLNRSTIEQNGKKLYLNKEDINGKNA